MFLTDLQAKKSTKVPVDSLCNSNACLSQNKLIKIILFYPNTLDDGICVLMLLATSFNRYQQTHFRLHVSQHNISKLPVTGHHVNFNCL